MHYLKHSDIFTPNPSADLPAREKSSNSPHEIPGVKDGEERRDGTSDPEGSCNPVRLAQKFET